MEKVKSFDGWFTLNEIIAELEWQGDPVRVLSKLATLVDKGILKFEPEVIQGSAGKLVYKFECK